MNITEILEYAKNKGEEVEFEFINLKGEIVKCRTLDAWFGLFLVGDSEGFVTEKQWKEFTGDTFNLRLISK
jgi:hypothetical protein